MGITLLVGGARSGKSARALRLASDWDGQVVFVATAEDRDSEMAARIARHRLERPASWRTIEAPLELVRAFDSIPAGAFVILDCLTLWVANALEAGWTDEDVERAAAAVATIAAGRERPTVVVTNEVGLGVVPRTALGRAYRDLLGRVNAVFAAEAEHAYLMIAGRTLELT
ncbi:MAG TPA: bifunctional adenosylcobinamide kinase/adenosylcobinamide-phosphate guanylyltransferase [Gaiellaceae bacterium]|nr:bifunctional adenosylcobinamide kinase/adenosylcobinamide-phosphate guanylyltransferase [Gaiellaceae bacterium]